MAALKVSSNVGQALIEDPGKNNHFILINNKNKTLLDTIKVSGQTDITIPSSGDLEMESGAGIQLTTDPSTGKITIASTTQANLSVDTFTADGNTKEFDLSRVPTQPVDVLVHVDSLYQAPSTYTIVGTSPAKLVFPENIPVNLEIIGSILL